VLNKIINKFRSKSRIVKMTKVFPYQICNVSKIHMSMKDNFLYKIAEICKIENNEKEAWGLSKKILNNNDLNKHKSLSEFYNIDSKILSNYSADIVFLPWIHYKPTKFNDVFFQVFYNEEYQYFQFKKIFDLVQSIKNHGYLPEKFPTRQKGISGYFLIKDNKKVFYVVSGNHRAAVLSSLFPDKEISVVLENLDTAKSRDIEGTIFEKLKLHPEYFSLDDAYNWPSVKSEFIDVSCAKDIFTSYFE
jgi:hypothetical protein